MQDVSEKEKQKIKERALKYGVTTEELDQNRLLERAHKYNTIPKD